MDLPMVAPAPIVTAHAVVCRDRCENPCPFRHVQHHLTGLIVLPNQRLAHRARGILDSADQTHLARLLSAAPWRAPEVNRRRMRFRLP